MDTAVGAIEGSRGISIKLEYLFRKTSTLSVKPCLTYVCLHNRSTLDNFYPNLLYVLYKFWTYIIVTLSLFLCPSIDTGVFVCVIFLTCAFLLDWLRYIPIRAHRATEEIDINNNTQTSKI